MILPPPVIGVFALAWGVKVDLSLAAVVVSHLSPETAVTRWSLPHALTDSDGLLDRAAHS